MIVHHLNCATMCPFGGRSAVGGDGKMVAHCLLVEVGDGLCLVDSGFGLDDVRSPAARLGKVNKVMIGPACDEAETAARRVEALGYKTTDVKHVIVTHLDLDHAGGLPDFPHAKVHIYAPEHAAAMARATLPERERYRPFHWAHGPNWKTYESGGEAWKGFACVRDLEGLPPEILMVPLPGHTRGHAAIAVDDGAGWLVHAGDAYFNEGEMDLDEPRCPTGLKVFQTVMAFDNKQRVANRDRLRELVREHRSDVRIFSAHDPRGLERFTSAPNGAKRPAAA